uniref:Uncharacterized protein n=1 Tax=Ascaris lumbricoides TaxID=6252 RepID=A0A0M3IFN7_ASCLU
MAGTALTSLISPSTEDDSLSFPTLCAREWYNHDGWDTVGAQHAGGNSGFEVASTALTSLMSPSTEDDSLSFPTLCAREWHIHDEWDTVGAQDAGGNSGFEVASEV